MNAALRSLVIATDIDVLPADRVVRRERDHLVVRSPSHPEHWEGNLLVFDDAPGRGDGERWEAAFAEAFADEPRIRHRVFHWDRADGEEGSAAEELESRGYTLERAVGLVASPAQVIPHPRASRTIEIRALDPSPGADEALWEGSIELQLADNATSERLEPVSFERFARTRQAERRALFAAGRGGAWYVAVETGGGARVLAACGVVATASRGRFQSVITQPDPRRRGLARALVAAAAIDAGARRGLGELVIVADTAYHARAIYESLGFRERERVCSAYRPPLPEGASGGDPDAQRTRA